MCSVAFLLYETLQKYRAYLRRIKARVKERVTHLQTNPVFSPNARKNGQRLVLYLDSVDMKKITCI